MAPPLAIPAPYRGAHPAFVGITATQDEAFKRIKPKLYKAYQFGTNASLVKPGDIWIKDPSTLAADFNPRMAFTGSVTTNSELQEYPGDFLGDNFVFGPDRLTLTGRIDRANGFAGPSWLTQLFQNSGTVTPDGAVNIPKANLGWNGSQVVEIDQLVALQYLGIYRLKAQDSTTAQLAAVANSPATATGGNMNAILPMFTALSSASHTGGTDTITFASLPAGVVPGMMVAYVSGGTGITRDKDVRISSISGGVITLNGNTTWGTLAANTRFIFFPPITSGAIWTKEGFDMSGGKSVWAFKWDLVMPNGRTNTYGINTSAAFAAVPDTHPWGAFPAAWFYNRNDGYTPTSFEMDALEFYFSAVAGPTTTLMEDIGGVSAFLQPIFRRQSNGYFNANNGYIGKSGGVAFQDADNKLQLGFIRTPDRTYRFVNGTLLRVGSVVGNGQNRMEAGLNLAVGMLNSGGAGNFHFPMKEAGFPIGFSVQRLEIYKID